MYDTKFKSFEFNSTPEFSFKNKKMLTLHGPPGTGKTTLAKVLAKRCGYEVRHINASDVRSGSKLLEAIKDAMTNDSYFDSK